MSPADIAARIVKEALADRIYRHPLTSGWEQRQLADRSHGDAAWHVRQAHLRAVWNAWNDRGRQSA